MTTIRKINASLVEGVNPLTDGGTALFPNGTLVMYQDPANSTWRLRLHNGVTNGGTDVFSAGNEITNTNGSNTYSVNVATTGVIRMNTGRGGLEVGAMPEIGGTTHLHIMRPAGQNSSTDLFFGDDFNYVKMPGLYGVDPNAQQGVEIGSSLNEGAVSVWKFGTDGSLTFPDATVQTTAYTGTALTTIARTGGTASVGEATAITVTNSPNTNWTAGTGVSANGINFVIAVDGSGNATVTIINDGGTGHFVGETFGPLPGSALGGTDGVDDVNFEVTAIDLPTTTALDLTKSVNKLTDGYYTLADGVEGQIMYLVPATGLTQLVNAVVIVASTRDGITALPNIALLFNSSIITLIFTDGAWQQSGGLWD